MGALTIKRFLVPLLTHPRVAQFIKYTVYCSLVINFFLYGRDDYIAWQSSMAPGAPLSEIITQFSTTIDMAAWLGLIFLLELETYVISDEAYTRTVGNVLRACRAVCYLSIGFAAIGYSSIMMEVHQANPVTDMNSLCEVADQQVWLQRTVTDYQEISSANCNDLSTDTQFVHLGDDVSLVGESNVQHLQYMSRVDVINAIVWVLVVLLIEAEVWLQSNDRFGGKTLWFTRQAKSFFYLVLIANGVIWTYTEYYLFAWDAFLWIFGFWAIELNLAEWERERLEELGAQEPG
jgi:hypothetical protein